MDGQLALPGVDRTFTAPVGGVGRISVTDGGELTLANPANTLAGSVVVEGVTSAAGVTAAGVLGTATLSLAGAGTLEFDDDIPETAPLANPVLLSTGGGVIDTEGHAGALSGGLSGPGGLTVIGNGRLTLQGVATYTGDTLVTAGSILSVGPTGTLGLPGDNRILIAAGASLRGTGRIGTPTFVSGTLAPGNSPGTLTFTSSVTLAPESVSAFDIDGTGTGTGPGNYSRAVVTGVGNTLAVAGRLQPLLRGIFGAATNTYIPPIGRVHWVESATGGITGSYAGLIQPAGLPAGTRFDTIYQQTSLGLVITPGSYDDLGAAGLRNTPNRTSVGRALDRLRPAPGVRVDPGLAPLLYPLYATPAGAVGAALDQVAPTIYGDALMTARDGWSLVADAITGQLAARRAGDGAGGGEAVAASHGLTFWLTGIGQLRHTPSGIAPGYHGSIGGVVAGVDKMVRPGLLAGVAVSGSSATTRSGNGASADATAVQFAAYGNWQVGRFFIDAQAGYVTGDQDIRRAFTAWNTSTRGTTTVDGGGGRIDAGMRLNAAGFSLEPTVGLSAMSLSGDDVRERPAGVLSQRVTGSQVTSVQSFAGVRVGRSFEPKAGRPVTLHALLGWSHEYADVAVRTGAIFGAGFGPPFTAVNTTRSRDAAVLQIGAEANVTGSVALYASYAASLASRGTGQYLTGGIKVRL